MMWNARESLYPKCPPLVVLTWPRWTAIKRVVFGAGVLGRNYFGETSLPERILNRRSTVIEMIWPGSSGSGS